MFFYLKVSSKDKKVLEKFVQFLSKLENSSTVLKHFAKQKQRKFITILKSPHVNKTAQEQFEFRFYSKQFLINSLKPLTYFLFLKKIKNASFPGIKLELKGLFSKFEENKMLLKLANPDNIITQNKRDLKISNQLKFFQTKYIQLFDCYGEMRVKSMFIMKKSFS
jgi:ribosomal protein S10